MHHSNLNVSSACLRSTASITERLLGSGCEKTFKALCSITLMCVIDTVRHLVLSIPAEAPSESVKSKNRLHPASAPPSLHPPDQSIVDIALAPWLLTPLEGSSPDGSLSGCFSNAVFARLTTLFGILLLFKQLQCMFGSTRELRMRRTWQRWPAYSIFDEAPSSSGSSRSSCSSSVVLQRCHPQICGPIELRMNY